MPDLSTSFHDILTNRQSQRNVYLEKLSRVQHYATVYNGILRWISTNRDSLVSFNSELEGQISQLETFVNKQNERIRRLVESDLQKSDLGLLQKLLARIERSWISFSAIGAKRQGKGHMLSTLLNLKPENDIFLARAGKPCTASVVTLYQGNKRKPIFNLDGSFEGWENIAENKAFVYFHTYDSIIKLIQKYFDKLNIDGVFKITQKTPESFKAECDKWKGKVESFSSNTADVEYKELLLDYLKNSKEYAKYLRNSEDTPPKDIDVLDLPLSQESEKVDFVNPELRKFISYYRRGESRKYFDVLAVNKVDIFTNYSLGSLRSDSFVISDTAGIGEAKLELRETLKELLRESVDIAIAVTEVPDNSNEDLSIPAQVIDFHNTISEDNCFICFPLQFYYIINVRKTTLESKSKDDIEGFRKDLINHLKNRGLPLPSIGKPKPWNKDAKWSKKEVDDWTRTHIKIIDTDDYRALNEYFEESVLPNVAVDINTIDSQLLSYVDTVLDEIQENDRNLIPKCKEIFDLIPDDEGDYYQTMVDEIRTSVLSVLKKDLENIGKAIASIKESDVSEKELEAFGLRDYQKTTLINSLKLLLEFQSRIEEFYCEPDSYRTIRAFAPDYIIREEDKSKCAQLKKALYDTYDNNDKRKAVSSWETTKWEDGKQQSEQIKLKFESDLSGVLEALNADEIGKLAVYRLDVTKELKDTTDGLLTDLAKKAYSLVIDMIWKSICEDGRFANIISSIDKDYPEQEILFLFSESQKYKPVLDVFEKLNTTELCVTDKALRKDLQHKLAASRIQPLTIQQPSNEREVPMVLADAFWNHLIAIEKDYKECVAIRFKKEAILNDFRIIFMRVISQTRESLIPHDVVHINEPCQRAFLNFYINHFQAVIPENHLQVQQIARKSVQDLKNIINI